MVLLKRAATLLALAAGLGMAGQAGAGAPPPAPVRLSAAWVGGACNADGKIAVILQNLSKRPLSVPRKGIVPMLFVFELHFPKKVISSYGHPYIYGMYPDHYVQNGGLKVLGPGETFSYDLKIETGQNGGEFGKYYEQIRRKGGQVTVRYVLIRLVGQIMGGTRGLYFVNDAHEPYIHSNMLTCPGENRR